MLELILFFGVWIPLGLMMIGVPLMIIHLVWRRRFAAALLVVAANVVIGLAFELFYPGNLSIASLIALWLLGIASVAASFAIWSRAQIEARKNSG
ncbi:hypothetical protein [Vitreimonas flagellata]|uniref:hypothetical protein n=1 Tax=Vitreimonas flagellata TaxID=2560861 RepID=UPI001074EBA0|nr:hypothetical protein [Vitreimonas flagellata]